MVARTAMRVSTLFVNDRRQTGLQFASRRTGCDFRVPGDSNTQLMDEMKLFCAIDRVLWDEMERVVEVLSQFGMTLSGRG